MSATNPGTPPSKVDLEIDTCGLNCPLPILRTKKALATLHSGQVLKVLATDPGAAQDFPLFAKQTGHLMLHTEQTSTGLVFYIQHRPAHTG
jgi:tRNA 2-thiouridine synthesizing protein A